MKEQFSSEKINSSHEFFKKISKVNVASNETQVFTDKNFINMTGELVAKHIDASDDEIESFSRYWNDLPKDNYLNDNGNYRQRRIGHIKLDLDTGTFEPYNDNLFFQTKEINNANGGILRFFKTVPNAFYQEPPLRKLINLDLKIFADESLQKIFISFHLFRIVCKGNEDGSATPEGIHRDGHLYVAQHFINRTNVYGGVSNIYDSNKNRLYSATLNFPLDSILIDDTKTMHDVTPISVVNSKSIGYRDMLIIDFNPLK